jgi:hypothetical protein
MEQINTTNYEAFYLDYLEGNLSEDVRLLFLDFLANNPDLQLTDEALPIVEAIESEIDTEFKTTLYQINTAYAPINHSNYSVFLLEAIENELTPEKVSELASFLRNNPPAQKEFELLKFTQLKPDLNSIFPAKHTLKKEVKRTLWPIYSALAAACLIGFFILTQIFSSNSVLNSSKKSRVQSAKKTVEKPVNKVLKNTVQTNFATKIEKTSSNQVLKNELPIIVTHIHEMPPRDCIVQLEIPANPNIVEEISTPIPTTTSSENLAVETNPAKSDEMRNPIQPITNRLGNLLNKEIDFKISKKTEDSKRGFLIKFGQFEISHNKK